jgi:hypothetical protein
MTTRTEIDILKESYIVNKELYETMHELYIKHIAEYNSDRLQLIKSIMEKAKEEAVYCKNKLKGEQCQTKPKQS